MRSGQAHFQITHTSRVIVQQHLVPFESPPDSWKPKEEGAEYPAQKSLALIWVLAKMELRATFLTDPFGFLAPALWRGLVFQVRFVSFTPWVAAIQKCPPHDCTGIHILSRSAREPQGIGLQTFTPAGSEFDGLWASSSTIPWLKLSQIQLAGYGLSWILFRYSTSSISARLVLVCAQNRMRRSCGSGDLVS